MRPLYFMHPTFLLHQAYRTYYAPLSHNTKMNIQIWAYNLLALDTFYSDCVKQQTPRGPIAQSLR